MTGRLEAVEGLLREWDPLGLMGDPDVPRDEYDSYACMLIDEARHGVGAVLRGMERIATHWMMLDFDGVLAVPIAERIVAACEAPK